MKLNVRKFQEGGPMGPEDPGMAPAPAEQGAPMPPEAGGAPAGGPGPEEQVMQMAQQIAQQIGDPQIIMMLADALMQIAQGAAQQAQPAYQIQYGVHKNIK